MKDLMTRVWEYSKNNPKGFTLNIETMEPVTSGISVAYQATQDSHSFESLELVINHALEHGKHIGGWSYEGKYYFDSVKVFPIGQKEEAEAFGRSERQIAYYIIDLGEEEFINYDNE